MEEVEAAEGGGDDATEAVGVEVEEGEVGEEAEFVGEVAESVTFPLAVDGREEEGEERRGGGIVFFFFFLLL